MLRKISNNQLIIAQELHETQNAVVNLVRELRNKKEKSKINHILVIKEPKDLAYYEAKLKKRDAYDDIKNQLQSLFTKSTGVRPSIRLCLNALFDKKARPYFGLTGSNATVKLQNTNLIDMLVGKMIT